MRYARTTILALAMTIASAQAQTSLKAFTGFFQEYDSYAVTEIRSRRFTQRELRSWLDTYVGSGVVSAREVGRSAEGRPLTLYRFGDGPTGVLLWSQMHGDEPTATMALVDVLSYLRKHRNDRRIRTLSEQLSVYMLPMINPDGAERFVRRTSQNIDMNRDAIRLSTPEAQTLKRIRDELRPHFGFNLHDQDPRYTVGTTGKFTAIALLAPPYNEEREDNAIRTRAKQLASLLAAALDSQAPGHIAKWDDTFEPRAFGDNVQRWGTSTVLIESGGWRDDPQKMFLRRLNAAALLTSLIVIADGSYAGASVDAYESLPFNMRRGFDLILSGCAMTSASGASYLVDVALNESREIDQASGMESSRWTVEEVGDLHTYTAYRRVEMHGSPLDPSIANLEAVLTSQKLESLIPLK